MSIGRREFVTSLAAAARCGRNALPDIPTVSTTCSGWRSLAASWRPSSSRMGSVYYAPEAFQKDVSIRTERLGLQRRRPGVRHFRLIAKQMGYVIIYA